VAGVIAAVLSLLTAGLVLLGVLATLSHRRHRPRLFREKREWTIRLVRLLFSGGGLLVSPPGAWGSSISHRRFFFLCRAGGLDFTMMAACSPSGGERRLYRLAAIVAVAATIGSALQIALQLPTVRRLARGLRLSLDTGSAHVRRSSGASGRSSSRGVVQVSAYIDQILSQLPGERSGRQPDYAQNL